MCVYFATESFGCWIWLFESSPELHASIRRPFESPFLHLKREADPMLFAKACRSILARNQRRWITTNFDTAGRTPLTKVVATSGPTSEQAGPLKDVCEAGMTCMRLNFSHATPEEVELRVTNLRAAQVSCGSLSYGKMF